MAVNLINGDDTQIVKTNDDIQVEFSQSRSQQIEEIENDVSNLQPMLPILLYDNDSGSNANITLNDSVENYKYIEIFYRNNDNFYSSRKFYNPSGKKIVLDSYYVSSTNIVFKMNYITITGTTVTRNQFIEASKNSITQNDTSTNTYITRIIGYN